MDKGIGGARLIISRISEWEAYALLPCIFDIRKQTFKNNSNEKGVEGGRLIIPQKNWPIGEHQIAQSFFVLQKYLKHIKSICPRPRAIETNQIKHQTH